jgi:hypothetical protein
VIVPDALCDVDAIAVEGPAEIQRIRVWGSRLATTDLRIDPAGVSHHAHAQEHSDMLPDREIRDQ